MNSFAEAFRQEQFDIRLDFFEGPMDLLLHLVQQREVSIENVDMLDIAEQYLEIVSSAKNLDLDRASEYLVIAATLIALKSQRLLPTETGTSLEATIDGLPDDVDPEYLEELRAKLKVYQLTKMQANYLAVSAQEGVDTFGRRVRIERPVDENQELEIRNDGTDLAKMFLGLLKRIGRSLSHYKVQLEPINVVQMMMRTLDSLKVNHITSFTGLLKNYGRSNIRGKGDTSSGSAKSLAIGSFISLLELMKRGLVSAQQDVGKGEISLKLKMLEVDEEELEKTFSRDESVLNLDNVANSEESVE